MEAELALNFHKTQDQGPKFRRLEMLAVLPLSSPLVVSGLMSSFNLRVAVGDVLCRPSSSTPPCLYHNRRRTSTRKRCSFHSPCLSAVDRSPRHHRHRWADCPHHPSIAVIRAPTRAPTRRRPRAGPRLWHEPCPNPPQSFSPHYRPRPASLTMAAIDCPKVDLYKFAPILILPTIRAARSAIRIPH